MHLSNVTVDVEDATTALLNRGIGDDDAVRQEGEGLSACSGLAVEYVWFF